MALWAKILAAKPWAHAHVHTERRTAAPCCPLPSACTSWHTHTHTHTIKTWKELKITMLNPSSIFSTLFTKPILWAPVSSWWTLGHAGFSRSHQELFPWWETQFLQTKAQVRTLPCKAKAPQSSFWRDRLLFVQREEKHNPDASQAANPFA